MIRSGFILSLAILMTLIGCQGRQSGGVSSKDQIPVQLSSSGGALAAFPGAQGGGAAAVGGRGGQIIEVTNLFDSGPGSLRACVQASGPRICVFRVSGWIPVQSRMQVFNPYLTIAGQTSPGGVWLANGTSGSGTGGDCLWISAHDVVVRYLGYSGDNPSIPTGPDGGSGCFEIASGGANTYNIVIDHVTARWYGNKAFAFESNGDATNAPHNITYSWNLEYEPICSSSTNCHPVGGLGVDASSGSGKLITDVDFHHNLIANIDHRATLSQSGWSMRWVNNIVYVFNQFAVLTMGGIHQDFIASKWVDGRLFAFNGEVGNATVHPILGERGDNSNDISDNCEPGQPCDNPGPPSWYLLNNIARSNPKAFSTPTTATGVVNDSQQLGLTYQGWEGGDGSAPIPSSWIRSTPLPTEAFPIIPDNVNNLDGIVTATVGASQHLDCNGNMVLSRVANDARVITQFQNRQPGTLFYGQYSRETLPAGTLCVESAHDGIPDQWKSKNMPSGATANSVASNGYTYLENYLNGVGSVSPVPTPAPPAPTPNPAPQPTPIPPAPTPVPNPPSGLVIIGLALVNTDKAAPVVGMNPMPSNAVVNLQSLGTTNLSVVADTKSGVAVGSVVFYLDSNYNHTENVAPYSLCGDNGGWNQVSCTTNLGVGSHVLKAVAYNKPGGVAGGGSIIDTQSISFSIEASALVTTRYEAESSSNTLGGSAQAFPSDCPSCSGGNEVGDIGGSGAGTLQFNGVVASKAGTFTIKIGYLDGTTSARPGLVSVNGGAPIAINFNPTGSWNSVGSTTVSVPLNAGNNILKFYNSSSTYMADLDYIDVTD